MSNELYLSAIVLISSLIIVLYFYLSRNFNYWSSRGIKGPKPIILLGTLGEYLFKKYSDVEEDRIRKYGNIYGIFEGTTPVLVVAEPYLVKNILVKDFKVFVNRRDVLGDPFLDRSLSSVIDDEWKALRSVISPAFTTSKLKKMHKLVEECAHTLDKKLESLAKTQNDIEMKKLMSDYSMDMIGSCAFAIKTNTHNDPNNPFMRNATKAFNVFRFVLFAICRPLMKTLNISLFNREVTQFFTNAIKEVVKQRKTDETTHHDFLQIMIDSQSTQHIENDHNSTQMQSYNEENVNELNKRRKTILTDEDILSNSFLFLLGGYETTANLLSYLTYLLAINPFCQKRLFEEIQQNIDKNGNIDYETIVGLKYLNACICETLRLYNPAVATTRVASQYYKLGETGITIPKGMIVVIPIHAIHHSSKFYPNPHQFDPNRFMPENRDNMNPFTYLPFGAGPRNCVGMGFALIETKTAIVRLITKYKFIRTKNTKIPIKLKRFSLHLSPKEVTIGVKLR